MSKPSLAGKDKTAEGKSLTTSGGKGKDKAVHLGELSVNRVQDQLNSEDDDDDDDDDGDDDDDERLPIPRFKFREAPVPVAKAPAEKLQPRAARVTAIARIRGVKPPKSFSAITSRRKKPLLKDVEDGGIVWDDGSLPHSRRPTRRHDARLPAVEEEPAAAPVDYDDDDDDDELRLVPVKTPALLLPKPKKKKKARKISTLILEDSDDEALNATPEVPDVPVLPEPVRVAAAVPPPPAPPPLAAQTPHEVPQEHNDAEDDAAEVDRLWDAIDAQFNELEMQLNVPPATTTSTATSAATNAQPSYPRTGFHAALVRHGLGPAASTLSHHHPLHPHPLAHQPQHPPLHAHEQPHQQPHPHQHQHEHQHPHPLAPQHPHPHQHPHPLRRAGLQLAPSSREAPRRQALGAGRDEEAWASGSGSTTVGREEEGASGSGSTVGREEEQVEQVERGLVRGRARVVPRQAEGGGEVQAPVGPLDDDEGEGELSGSMSFEPSWLARTPQRFRR
ncbi:hypothetical protein JCM3775_003543 [Rhodotorula graminis]